MNGLGWRAVWSTTLDPFEKRLLVMRPHPDGSRDVLVLEDDGTFSMNLVAVNEESPSSAFIRFPEGVADAIIEASAQIGEGGRAAEIRVLREWLDREQGRVDVVIESCRGPS